MDLFRHDDALQNLNRPESIRSKIGFIHETLNLRHPFIDRIAIATYDEKLDLLSTYASSSQEKSPLENYQAKLSDCSSLLDILSTRKPRLVDDLSIFEDQTSQHTKVVRDAGYRSSYTFPLCAEGNFLGFLFFNSKQAGVFTELLLSELDMTGHLIAFMLFSEQSKIRTLIATVRSARQISQNRDPETGAHLERMSHYSRLIASALASKHGFSDSYIEHIFLFSTLHDIGKITVPDRILLKPGPLTDDEFELMQSHSKSGGEIIDKLLHNYGLEGVEYIEVLRNIALYHHESVDGSGYPEKLAKENIPIEARIVSVADVFDALTSKRPYKEAWDNDTAFEKMREMAGKKLDAECVEALLSNVKAIEEIQQSFQENEYG